MNKINNIFFDLDGTLYFKGKLIKDADKTIKKLRDLQYKIGFLTNTDSLTPIEITNRINSYGIEAYEYEVINPVSVALNFINQNKTKKFFLLTSDSVTEYFNSKNIYSVNDNPDFIIIGDFREKVSYDLINRVFRHINNGAELVGFNKGKFFYNDEGINIDTGGFISLFEYSSDKRAIIIGKPEKIFFDMALVQFNAKNQQSLVVGDDITVDIAGANNAGIKSVIVKTGKYNNDIVINSIIKPDFTINSVAEIFSLVDIFSI